MLMLIKPHWTGLTSDPKLLLDVRICAESRDLGCTFTVVWLQVCAKLHSNHKPQSQSTSYRRGYRSAPWETSQYRPEKDLQLFISCFTSFWSPFQSGHLSRSLSHLFSLLYNIPLDWKQMQGFGNVKNANVANQDSHITHRSFIYLHTVSILYHHPSHGSFFHKVNAVVW